MTSTSRPDLAFIRGRRVLLRPLLEADFTYDYLDWLNSPEVNRYSQRRSAPVSWDQMTRIARELQANPRQGFNLAIIAREESRHIGNISLSGIQPVHRCADLAILIGDARYWNRGFAAESIYALTRHAFEHLNLHKLMAGSFNPAFVRCVETKLGWVREGVFRERIWSGDRYHDQIWLSILEDDFKRIDVFEEPCA